MGNTAWAFSSLCIRTQPLSDAIAAEALKKIRDVGSQSLADLVDVNLTCTSPEWIIQDDLDKPGPLRMSMGQSGDDPATLPPSASILRTCNAFEPQGIQRALTSGSLSA